jgi:hypothetical protein
MAKEIRLNLTSAHGGPYFPSWSFDDKMYCPGCGKLGIWISADEDYYQGATHVCVECDIVFNYGETGMSTQEFDALKKATKG